MNVQLSGIDKLSESLDNVAKNTAKILHKLQSFENRLSIIDGYISHIRAETLLPSKAKKNIDATLIEIEKIHEYFKVSTDVEPIIQAGISDSMSDYLYAIERLCQAKTFFEKNNVIKASSTLLGKINGQLYTSNTACLVALDNLLKSIKKIIVEESETNELGFSPIYPLDESTANDIKTLFASLTLSNSLLHLKLFITTRYKALITELKLFETQSNLTSSITSSNVTYQSSNLIAPYTQGPYIKGSHIITKYFNYCTQLLKAEYSIASTTLPQNSDESLQVILGILTAVIDEMIRVVNSSLLINMDVAKKTDILFQSNSVLIQLDAFHSFMLRYADLWEVSRADVAYFQTCGDKLASIKDLFGTTCAKSIDALLITVYDTSNVASVIMPDSCDASNLTNHSLHCCRQLSDLSSAYRTLLEHLSQRNKQSESSRKDTSSMKHPPASLVALIHEIIHRLLCNLDQQMKFFNIEVSDKASYRVVLANSMSSHSLFDAGEKEAMMRLLPARRHIFLLNNLYPIAILLTEKEEIFSIKGQTNLSELLEVVKKRILSEQESFCQVIQKAIGFAPDDIQFSKQFEKDAASKAKLLKAKFSFFNACIDVLITQKGEWRVMNPDLRAGLNEQLKDTVLALYCSFFNENSKVQFSKKHTQQYLKYPPDDVSSILTNFF